MAFLAMFCPRISPNDFQMLPVAPVITGITVGFTIHKRSISTVMSLYLKFFFFQLIF
jgi:hypothetical protein